GGAEPGGREAGGGVVDEEAAGGGEGAGGAQVAGAAEAGGEESLAELLVVLRVEAVGIDYRGRHVAGEGSGEEAPQARLSHPDQAHLRDLRAAAQVGEGRQDVLDPV